jgi:hypothetical protein
VFDVLLSRLAHSIDARFRLVVVAVFGLGTLVSLVSAWYDAGSAADESYDRLLQSAAVQFLDSAVVLDDEPQLVPPSAPSTRWASRRMTGSITRCARAMAR